jgi:hypothetical protein
MANPPVWTRAFTNGTVIPNYKAAGVMSDVWGGGALADAASKVFTNGLPTNGYTPAAEWKDLAKAIKIDGIDTAAYYSLAPNSFSISGLTGVDGIDGIPKPTAAWTFITAPQQISWDYGNQVNRVDMFGTNNPPAVSGTRGMAELNLSDSLVEGFTRGVQIEGKIAALQNLMNYGVNRELGFVDVPVYQVSANDKTYGPNGYFVIKSVKVQEQMRDLDGNMTRAKVDISLMQVPEFQVSNGRDLASKAATGVTSPVLDSLAQFKPGANQLTTRFGKVLKSEQITSGKNAGYFETTYERPDGTIQRKVTAKQQK